MGSALCVMAGRLRSLGHTYFSYMSTGSALDVMDYGSAKAESSTQDYLLVLCLYDLYLQVISITAEQYTFCFFPFYGEDPVSDLSLHVLWALRSTLWVFGYSSLVMPIPPTRARAPCSMLWTMG